MASRFHGEINGLGGNYYKVELLDSDFVGSSVEWNLANIEIDNKGENSERWTSIWASMVSVMVQSTAAVDLNTVIGDILDAVEGRFQIAIYKKALAGDSYTFEWIGIVLNDLSGGTDEAPVQSFSIVATDGVGALKGIDYSVDSDTVIGQETAAVHLLNALQKLPYNAYFGATDAFLKISVPYFESNMVGITVSALDKTVLPGTMFYEIDKNGLYKFNSCFEVINKICQLFYSRIYFGGGTWRMVNVRSWETASSLPFYTFLFNQSMNSSLTTETTRYTIDQTKIGARISGQTFDYFAALQKVSRAYQHDTSQNLVQGLSFTSTTAIQTVGVISESGTESLMVAGALYVEVRKKVLGTAFLALFVKVRLTIKINSYYLKRTNSSQNQNNDYTDLSWNFGVAYVDYIAAFSANNTVSGNMILSVAFESPTFPDFGVQDLEVQIEKVSITDLGGNSQTADYNYSCRFNSLYLEYIDGDAENLRIYEAYNDSADFFSEVAELDTLNIGDKINDMTQNRIKIDDGSAIVDSDGEWGRNTITGTKPLLQLVLNDIMAGQRRGIKKRNGSFFGLFEPWKVLAIGGEYFVPLGVRLNVADSELSGVWYWAGTYDDSTIVENVLIDYLAFSAAPPSVLLPVSSGSPALPVGIVATNNKMTITPNGTANGLEVKTVGGGDAFSVDYRGRIAAESVNLGSGTASSAAILQLNSTAQGFLPPRMTATQRDSLETAVGLMIYQTDGTEGFYFYKSTGWVLLGG
jgi:hypothetical protein